MTGGLNLATTTGVPVPATVTVDQFWAVNGTLVWSTAPESTSRTGSGGSELNVTAIDGPPWDAGSTCDLIVRVHGGDGSVQLLRVSGVVIVAIV